MNSIFYGEYQHTIDPKGRVIMPAKLREGLGEKFIITKGLDNCLFAYSEEEWNRIVAKIKELPFTDKDVRAFVRFFFSGASECEVDKQGRILIPGNLREYAGMDKDVVVIGASTRVEIWDKKLWDDFNNSNLSADKLAERMSQLGI